MLKTIKISKRLAKKLRLYDEQEYSSLFLVGKNDKDVITRIFELPSNNEGCEFEQGVDGSDMAREMLNIYKKKLIPGGFFYINTCFSFGDDLPIQMGDFAEGLVSKREYMRNIVYYIFSGSLESLNYKHLNTPVIVVCENNLYAKYKPSDRASWRNLKIVEV